jgi:hypothetical protein
VQQQVQLSATTLANAEQTLIASTTIGVSIANNIDNHVAEVRNYRMNIDSFMSALNDECKRSCNKCQVSNHNIRTIETSTTPTDSNYDDNIEYHDVVSDSSFNDDNNQSDINHIDPQSLSEVEPLLDFSTIYEDNQTLSDVFKFEMNIDIHSKLKSYEEKKSISTDLAILQSIPNESPFDYSTLQNSLKIDSSYVPCEYMVSFSHVCLLVLSPKSYCYGRFARMIPYGDPQVLIPPEPPPLICF